MLKGSTILLYCWNNIQDVLCKMIWLGCRHCRYGHEWWKGSTWKRTPSPIQIPAGSSSWYILHFTCTDFAISIHCGYSFYLQGKSPTQAWTKVRSMFWSALLWNWAVWGCAQYVNMNYVPLKVCVHAEAKDPQKTLCACCSSKSYLTHFLLSSVVSISTFFSRSVACTTWWFI